jgi:hypothetical protein
MSTFQAMKCNYMNVNEIICNSLGYSAVNEYNQSLLNACM